MAQLFRYLDLSRLLSRPTGEASLWLVCAAVGAALIVHSHPTIAGIAMAAGIVAFFSTAIRVLGERRTLRRQVQALEKLTARAMIDESGSFTRLVNEFLKCCRPLIRFNRARVWVYDDSEMLLKKICEHKTELRPLKKAVRPAGKHVSRRLGEELVGRVAERGVPMILRDIRRDPRHPFYRLSAKEKAKLGPVSLIALPLVACGDVVGVVEFERNAWSAYKEADRLRVQSLATLVAMGIANIAQHRNICRQAVTDGLTGLSNKRHILQALAVEVRRAERYKHPLSVMMLDLDGFKAYNDTFGHLLGDVLLQQVGQLIHRSIRATDSAGRYGGEEFLVILPETDKEGAAMIAERIRAQVAAARFPGAAYRASSPGALAQFVLSAGNTGEPEEGYTHKTISIGVATCPQDSTDLQNLLALADDALYRAKRGGRNQVVLALSPKVSEDSAIADSADVAA